MKTLLQGGIGFNNAVYIKSIIPLTNECRLFYHLVHSWKGKNDKNAEFNLQMQQNSD